MIDPTLTNIMLVSPTSRRMPRSPPPWRASAFLPERASIGAMRQERRRRCFGYGLRGGNVDVEGRAALTREQPDPSPHAVGELARDVEAEAGPADTAPLVGIETVELLEDPVALGRLDALAVVADGETDRELA